MARVAAIDCGTNALRLLVSDGGRDITRINEIVRLGEGVDATGRIDPAAIARTRKVLEHYARLMKFENVTQVRMVATSATRDAENREDFFSMTEEVLGKPAEVISGEQEAELSFAGAVGDLDPAWGPYCVIDLGGGSTEFIVGNAEGTILGETSVQMGCVRLTERIMRSDPATELEVETAREYVAEQMRKVIDTVPLGQAVSFVGVAGTFTTLSALAQGLERYDATEIHGSELRFEALRILTRQLQKETCAQRASHPVMHPGRADVIAGGTVVVDGVMDAIQEVNGARSFIISEKDILDGIVKTLS